MGKGGKRANKNMEVAAPEEDEDDEVFNQNDVDESDFDDEGDIDEDFLLLKKIQEEIVAANQPLKLSWAAIHSLKIQEQALMEKMDKQMADIQEKYDKLKEPISHEIAKVVSGVPVEKKRYTEHELTQKISPNKHKPDLIPDFWATVLEKSGFIDNDVDMDIMKACKKITCSRNLQKKDEEEETETLTVELEFLENPYFENKNLKLEVKRVNEECQKVHVDQLELKGEKDDKSLILNIFDPESASAPVFQCAQDIERAYKNSLFFFFHEEEEDNEKKAENNDEDDEDLDYDEEDNDEDEEQDEEEEEEEEEEEQVEKGKPKKRKALDNMEKPDCKQQ